MSKNTIEQLAILGERIKNTTYSATVGGVEVVVDGKGFVKSLKVTNDTLLSDKALLEDVIMAAILKVQEDAETSTMKEMAKMNIMDKLS